MARSGTNTISLLPGPPLLNASSRRRFIPPTEDAQPLDLFQLGLNHNTVPAPRFIRLTDPTEMLIFVDGASAGNGTPQARGGYGIFFRAENNISLRLELDGQPQTSNRAELRAAIAALDMRWWKGEGFTTVVVASDSEYVVLGVCERLAKWRRNGWKTAAGRPVANRDLWERLVLKLDEYGAVGLLVRFWRIGREWNGEADALAKMGATLDDAPNEFTKLSVFDYDPRRVGTVISLKPGARWTVRGEDGVYRDSVSGGRLNVRGA